MGSFVFIKLQRFKIAKGVSHKWGYLMVLLEPSPMFHQLPPIDPQFVLLGVGFVLLGGGIVCIIEKCRLVNTIFWRPCVGEDVVFRGCCLLH